MHQGNAHRETEESGPNLCLPVVGRDKLLLRLQESREEVTMAVLILAPVFEVLENGVQLLVGVLLQMAVNGDVTPISNLLRQVCCIEDELWLEESVLPVLREETKIQCQPKVRHGLVQETSVACFITGHEGENFRDHRIRLLLLQPQGIQSNKPLPK